MQSCTQKLDQKTTQKPRSVIQMQSHDQSKNQIKPEPRYQHVTVPKSNQSNVVKLEPSAGPTLFLNRTTADCSTTATAIRIQYCVGYTQEWTLRQGRDLHKGSSMILGNKYRGNGKAVYKEALQDKRRQSAKPAGQGQRD